MKKQSIQGNGHKPGRKSSTARLQAETLKKAGRQGMPWEDDEVSLLAKMIENDDTTYDMALALGRSYYSAMAARHHVGFVMRHSSIWAQITTKGKKKQ